MGSPEISSILFNHSSKLSFNEVFHVSQKLYKKILKVNREIEREGLPKNLKLAYVHSYVKTGVFLKTTSKPIEEGTFIGIYTGRYELVELDSATGVSYAYGVAEDIRLTTKYQHLISKKQGEKKRYSIQTNALEMGNFTRYINHSSLEPNIEAILSKLPDGRLEILLFAFRKINPGEQLLSNYGGEYWKALEIIPNDMKADTYLLTSESKVKLSNPIPSLPIKYKNEIMPLRNVLVHTPSSSKILKDLKEKIAPLSKGMKKEISIFEDMVLEQGLPRKWKISSQNGSFSIILKSTEKSIRKNRCLGFVSGAFSHLPSKQSFLVAEKRNQKLFLDTSKESNFLSRLPECPSKGNVIFRLLFDEEKNLPLLVAFAAKTIRPKDKLVLKGVHISSIGKEFISPK